MSQFFTQPVIKTKKSSTVRQNKNVSAVDVTRKALQEMGFMNTSSELNIVLGTGTTSERSVVPVAGETRLNTTTGLIETYNGTAWVSVDGYTEYTTALTSTNLKNLRATPINVLAAAGTGFYWDIQSVRITYTYASAAYTNTNVTDLKIYDNTTSGTAYLLDSTLFTNTATRYAKFEPQKTWSVAANSIFKVSVTGSAELLAGSGTASIVITAKKVAA